MNYLAHLYLAERTPESLLGNLMGDFVRGRAFDGFSETVRRGIRLHRSIDAYTDAHEIVRRSKARIGPANRRYAGPIVDVFYDHFLAAGWPQFAPEPLGAFASNVYAVLEEHRDRLPERLQWVAPRMIEQDWLCSYATVEGTAAALRRMARRVRRENHLAEAAEDLVMHYDDLRADFRAFFPDVVRYSRSLGRTPPEV